MAKRKSNKKQFVVKTKTLVAKKIEIIPYVLLVVSALVISLVGSLWLMVFCLLVIRVGQYG